MRLSTWTRRTSRAALAASYLIAFLGPIRTASADPLTVTVGPDAPYVDWTVTFVEGDVLDITVSTGVDCPLDFTETPDPYLFLLDESGNVDYSNDDGAHAEVGDCYSSRLYVAEPVGTFTLRFDTFQRTQQNAAVPEGSWTVTFAEDTWTPTTTTTTTTAAPTTTTTSTTTLAPTTTSTTTTAAPTTTTTSTTTVSPTTTTTVAPTTTSEAPPSTTTTQAPTTTTTPPTTSTSTSSTTSTTTTSTTTLPPTTTSTTTSTSTTTTTVPLTTSTTTTTIPPVTTIPPPVTTLPPTTSTSPPTTTTTTSTTTTTVPPTTSTTTLPEPLVEPDPQPPELEPEPNETELEPAAIEALTAITADADADFVEDVTIVLTAITDDDLNADEIEALVNTFEQVVQAEAFDNLDLDQIGALGDQINSAPDEVKAVFEEAAADEMFDGTLDDYIATNSTIDNGDRRTVIAVTAASTAALAMPRPTPPSAPTTGPSASSGPSGPTRKNRR